MMLVFSLSLIVVGIATEYVPPESLNNIAHIEFPRDRLTARIVRLQRDVYGIKQSPCSSLLGPYCVTNQILNKIELETRQSNENQETGVSIKRSPLILGSQQIALNGESAETSGVLANVDPRLLAEVADRVAEIAPVENQEEFRHKVLSAFANVIGRIEQEDEDDEASTKQGILQALLADPENQVVVHMEQRDLDWVLKAVQETVSDLLKGDKATDSTTGEGEEEEEEDEYED